MEVSALPVASSHKEKLISAGYTTLLSIIGVSASRLAQELIIPHCEAMDIIKITLNCSRAMGLEGTHALLKGARTAWEMLSDEQNLKHISTGCEDFDGILGGGIHCGEVTEVGGVPGIGKTQLGIQLAVNVQIPVSYGGLGAKAIYIDTEGSFMPERAYQIAEACIMDIWENLVFPHKDNKDCQERMQPDHFLSNILYFRICSYTEQIAVINYLDKFLEEHKDVLLLNHVTAKHTEGQFQLTLALGDTWSHSCTNRIILYWDGDERHARIEKSPYLPSASAPFSVTNKGIRDAVSHCKRARMMYNRY
ncbi:DNA repair protein RAD51 homolog 3 isoform X3 [Phalaenopsis equestris]|uniref:DNA repair protein RAD51 homolog 3 isoform X3 n=1 Tax=Phalaenopsis equestris TaxID=78828 RepID=UPI0009E4C05D|nr:DNA repair protein RAD51 homolog 3 isoform X3 [Phalaenopsis equestris]